MDDQTIAFNRVADLLLIRFILILERRPFDSKVIY